MNPSAPPSSTGQECSSGPTSARIAQNRTAQKILVIAGCTATGKTRSALALAKRYDGELIGADSVQVYRGFDIGSAKPSAEELGGIPHHLIDVVDPDEKIDAMDFAGRADAVIAAVQARGHLPIVVGGTGLWLRALLRGLVKLPPVDPILRQRILDEAERLGREAMHARLQKVDPLAAGAIHPRDIVRVGRALEVFEQTGQALGQLRAQHKLGADRYDSLFVLLERDDTHDERIETRLAQMIAAGWRDETRALLKKWPRTARAFGSVGYRQVVEHLEDDVDWDETQKRIRKVTRIYARRQRTWFGSEPGIDWRTGWQPLIGEEGQTRIEAWL